MVAKKKVAAPKKAVSTKKAPAKKTPKRQPERNLLLLVKDVSKEHTASIEKKPVITTDQQTQPPVVSDIPKKSPPPASEIVPEKPKGENEQILRLQRLEKELKEKESQLYEYQAEITELRNKIQQMKQAEAYDATSLWETIAWNMAEYIAMAEGKTVKEVLNYYKNQTGNI